jgi:Na+/phosphate symporter
MSISTETTITEMTQTTLTFEEIDTLLQLIEFHDDWDEVSEIMGRDINALYDKLSEMRDEV